MIRDNVFEFRPIRDDGRYDSPLASPPDLLLDAAVANERAFLGALLHNLRNVDYAPEGMRPEHFGWGMHQEVFRAAKALRDAGSVGAMVDVGNALRGCSDVTPGDIVDLYGAMIDMSAKGIRQRGEAVLSLAGRRALRQVLRATIADTEKGDLYGSLDGIGSKLHSEIEEAVGGLADEKQGADLDEAMADAMDAYERTVNGEIVGISTGLRALDEGLGFMEPDQMIVAAARPGMGKTALGIGIAVAAARKGKRVLVISLEMSRRELGRRILCAAAGVPVVQMKRGNGAHADALVKAQKELLGLKLRIEDASGQTPSMIAVRSRSYARRWGGIDLIVVDHIHIVKADGGTAEKHGDTQAVGHISNSMKRLAKDLHCPVLALAQLNRGPENREDKRPTLGDLRQSGAIEQDADAVLFLHRPEYYLSKAEPEKKSGEAHGAWQDRVDVWTEDKQRLAGVAEVIVAKNRDGAGPVVPLVWHGETTSFSEPPAYDEGRSF